MAAAAARHSVGALHALLVFALAYVALRAWMTTSVRKWPEHVFSDPWATAAFTDFLAGLPLILSHVWTTHESAAAALAWTAGVLVFGHVATMLYGMFRVWTHDTLADALLPQRVVLPTTDDQRQQVSGTARALQVLTALALALYAIFGIRALIVEDQRVGFAYVTRNYWPLTLLANTLAGQVFAAVYIALREGSAASGGGGAAAAALAWILAVVLFGNAATCVYMIMALNSARSVREGILGRYPVGTRGGYAPVP